jgi:thiol-disulfide isomerase/thioredoxin
LNGRLVAAGLFFFASLGAIAQTSGVRKAPELAFTLPVQRQKLLSQYRGKVVAIEFILTTCPHCQAASQVMTKLQAEFGADSLQVLDLAINGLEQGRTPEQASELADKFRIDYQVGFPVGWIPQDQMMAFMGFNMAQRMMVPQLVLIDRRGFIHYQTPPLGDVNSMQEATIRDRLKELLAIGPSAHRSSSRQANPSVASARKPS